LLLQSLDLLRSNFFNLGVLVIHKKAISNSSERSD